MNQGRSADPKTFDFAAIHSCIATDAGAAPLKGGGGETGHRLAADT